MFFYQATVSTTTEFADTLSVILIDLGSDGVKITDGADILEVLKAHTWDYVDESLLAQTDPVAYVSGYYPEDYDFSALTEKLNELRTLPGINAGSLELSLEKINSADYENEWKKYYSTIELNRIAIVPEWIKYNGDKLAVYIDPGPAFGTGSHETTRLCLKMLEQDDVTGLNCIDIGCGSGILGAAALKLGAKSCTMIDIDEQATAASEHNCALNGVLDRADIRTGVLTLDYGKFDLALANITADVLISIAQTVSSVLNGGAKLITSGIIHSRAQSVKEAYLPNFELIEAVTDGEWQAMTWRKK